MIDSILDQPLSLWQTEGTLDKEHIVLSSRIRLARNFKGIAFTNRDKEDALEKVDTMMRRVPSLLTKVDGKSYSDISLDKLSGIEREVLVEKHLVSPNLVERVNHRSVIISDDGAVAIMVNEEDHIRIQSMAAGLDLTKAYERAVQIDDAIESTYDYAFSEKFGYLTACPTNVGTGMRASVMLHLPALAITGKLNRVVRSIIQLGYSVRGLYGEGSEGLGNIYQVSNQVTMGISEEDTIAQLNKIIEGLIKEEEKARQSIAREHSDAFEDRVWRAYGVLAHARKLSGAEALSLLSDVQLGIDMGILHMKSNAFFDKLVVITRPNFLSKYAGQDSMTADERDAYRAKVVRDALNIEQ